MEKLTVAILFGGRSGEHEVSLQSARSVMDQINREKYDVFPSVSLRMGYGWLEKTHGNHCIQKTPITFYPLL